MVGCLSQTPRDALQPLRNDHLSKREFPGSHDIPLGSKQSFQMLNEVNPGSGVGCNPFSRIPPRGHPDVGCRHVVSFGCPGAKQLDVGADVEPTVWTVVSCNPATLVAKPPSRTTEERSA